MGGDSARCRSGQRGASIIDYDAKIGFAPLAFQKPVSLGRLLQFEAMGDKAFDIEFFLGNEIEEGLHIALLGKAHIS